MKQRWQDQNDDVLAWRATAIRFVKSLSSPSVLFTHFLLINAIVGEIMKVDRTLYFWPENCSITHIRSNGISLGVSFFRSSNAFDSELNSCIDSMSLQFLRHEGLLCGRSYQDTVFGIKRTSIESS